MPHMHACEGVLYKDINLPFLTFRTVIFIFIRT